MSTTINFKDTTKINKGFSRAMLEGVYIGNVFNLNVFNYPAILTGINSIKYLFSSQTIKTLSSAQIRMYGDYTIIESNLVKYYQIQIPNILNTSSQTQQKILYNYSSFLGNIKTYKNIEIFYYDRPEQINDFNHFFEQLDTKISQTNNSQTPQGLELSSVLRYQMPEYIEEIINTNMTRAREAFLIIQEPIKSNKIIDLQEAADKLDSTCFKLLNNFKQFDIVTLEVVGEHREWLLSNFVSNVTEF